MTANNRRIVLALSPFQWWLFGLATLIVGGVVAGVIVSSLCYFQIVYSACLCVSFQG